MADLNYTVYDNEDLHRDFQLKEGASAEAATATDITDSTISAEIRDETNTLILRMTSTDNTTLKILDAEEGRFGFRIDRELLPTNKKLLKYDVLITDADGYTRRLWGGKITVKIGVTQDT